MGKKGGAEDNSSESLTKSINTKIILTTIMFVLIGAAFVLMMIFAGIQVSQKYEQNEAAINQKEPEVERVIELEYEAYEYTFGTDSEYSKTNHSQNLVFEQLDEKGKYILIDSPEKLGDVLDAITRVRGGTNTEMPKIEEGFFDTGALIAVGVQDRGFSDGSVAGVHRDADNNVFITLRCIAPYDTMSYGGAIYLIKIPNIQPNTINVSTNTGTAE